MSSYSSNYSINPFHCILFFLTSVKVSEKHLYITLKLNIHMVWMEHRLAYLNLRDKSIQNLIRDNVASTLWTPPLILANTYLRTVMTYTNLSSLVVVKKGSGKVSSLDHIDESQIYGGSNNPLQLSNRVSSQFDCLFSMFMFPFDNQTCFVQVCTYPLQLPTWILSLQLYLW